MLNGNGTSCAAHLALHRRQRFQIGEQVAHVVEPHALVGRVGKRRIVVTAVRRGALQHRGDEIRLAPFADAVVAIGRDVRRIERAERRFQPEPAAELGLVLLIGRRVAGRAAARVEHGLAVFEIGRMRGKRARRHRRRDGHDPEHADADTASNQRQQSTSLRSIGVPSRCRSYVADRACAAAKATGRRVRGDAPPSIQSAQRSSAQRTRRLR